MRSASKFKPRATCSSVSVTSSDIGTFSCKFYVSYRYRIEINGKPHMRLASNAQSCTLIKCKPGKTYKIVLVALTCTEEVKKERRKRVRQSGTEY